MIELDFKRIPKLIRADILLNKIAEYRCNNCLGNGGRKNCEECPISHVEQIVEEEPNLLFGKEKTAHWDINTDGYYPFCSHCGEATQRMSPYCSNCGAKMVTRRHEDT